MAGRKNPSAQAIDAVLDEYRAIRKRGKRVRHHSAASSTRDPVRQWFKDRGIRMRDLR